MNATCFVFFLGGGGGLNLFVPGQCFQIEIFFTCLGQNIYFVPTDLIRTLIHIFR